jgi:hypothetical protein
VIPQVEIQSFSLGSLNLSGRTSRLVAAHRIGGVRARTAALRQGFYRQSICGERLTAFANANRFRRVNISGIFFMSIMTHRVSHDESFELGTNGKRGGAGGGGCGLSARGVKLYNFAVKLRAK